MNLYVSETLEAWPHRWIPQQRRHSVSTSALFGFELKKTNSMQNIFRLLLLGNFGPETKDIFHKIWHKMIFSSFCWCCQFVQCTKNATCSFHFLDVKHDLYCGSTSVVQFLFCKHVFACSININVIIWHTGYFCSSSENSSADNQMWFMKEKSQRKGAFSHCIYLNAEGIFLCTGETADILCIIFDYAAIAYI